MDKIQKIVFDELNTMRFHKIIYMLSYPDYLVGFFGKLLHCDIESNKENFNKFQIAIREYIQARYELLIGADIEYEYEGNLYKNLFEASGIESLFK